MAVISAGLHFEKDRQQAKKARIRRQRKIKAGGITAHDWSRFLCLHIGLSTAPTVPRLRNEARYPRVKAASICAFSQCHLGSFASSSFAVSLGAWLAPMMTRAFARASAARATGTIGAC